MLKSRLFVQVLSIATLSLIQVLGMQEMGRSQAVEAVKGGTIVQQSTTQTEIINQLIEQLKSRNAGDLSAIAAIGNIGEPAKSAIPKLVPLIQDSDRKVMMQATLTLGYMGKSAESAVSPLGKWESLLGLPFRVYCHYSQILMK